MTKNYYDILGIGKSANEAEIKKAYKKQAMQYHPDRNKWDKKAEAKFKEINEAYQTLGDKQKKKSYDQFGSAEGNPFTGGANPFGGSSRWQSRQSQSTGYEDIFSQFSGGGQNSDFGFDIGDLFSGMGWERKKSQKSPREESPKAEIEANLDVIEVREIPFMEFLFDSTLTIQTVYGKNLTLKIKSGTKPGTKYKISGKGRSMDGKTGDMYVIVDAKMPKEIPENLKPMLEAIRYQL